jgi:hypothetical protein
MFDRLITAYRHFLCLRRGEYEQRKFSILEAITEIYFELFA